MPRKSIESDFSKKIVIYKTSKGPELEVRLEKETIWLDAHQIAMLFWNAEAGYCKACKQYLSDGRIGQKSTCSILEQVAADGKIRKMNLYNLDMIISGRLSD